MTRRLALPTLAAGVALLTGLAGGGPADAASPGANGKITWISPTEPAGFGTWDVWTMNADGTEPTNLLPGGDLDEEHPSWSPDGRRIAFARVTGSPSGCFFGDIYVMDADGSNVEQLTTNPLGTTATQPTWSPDGTRIAFERGQQDDTCNDGDSEIWVMNADGTGQTAITSGGIGISNGDGEPDWSPDGNKIAFTGRRPNARGSRLFGIFTINPDGSQLTRLTGDPISFIRTLSPAWSPDGQRIAYEQKDLFDGSDEIWMMNADGSGHTAVTRNGFLSNWNPTWSPDGQQIAFSAQDDPITFDNEIFVINVDGTGQTAITNNTTGDSFPDWQHVPAADEPPTLTDTDPDSPADDNNPRVKGSAPGAVTVTLYTSPDCSGTPAAQGTAAEFSSPGLQVTVPDNSSTTFRATATTAAGNVSACSSSSIGYVEETAPPPPSQGIIRIELVGGEGVDVEFQGSGPGELVFFTLDDDGLADLTHSNQRSLVGALAGSWTIEQRGTLPLGWDLTAIDCADPDSGSSTSLLTATAQIDLDPDETIVCTFTVTRQQGTVVINLDAVPDDPQDFNFDIAPQPLTLDDDTDPTLPSSRQLELAAGNKLFRLPVPAGWRVTAITCSDPDNGTTLGPGGNDVIVDLDAGETVTCTFTVTRQQGTVVINLDAVPDDPQDFNFDIAPQPLTLDDDTDPTLPSSRQFQLAAGTRLFRLPGEPGWALTAITCTDPDNGTTTSLLAHDAVIDLDPGETITCTFTVTKLDTTPPTLTLPPTVERDATSPTGAVVAYSVTASDAVDPSPSVACAPASGSVFPIGTTTVNCTARDSAGNTATGSFTVRVRGASEQIVRLIAKTLVFLDLPVLAETLTARLAAIADAPLDQRRTCAALRTYQTLVRPLPALVLTPLEKAELLADATRISAIVGC